MQCRNPGRAVRLALLVLGVVAQGCVGAGASLPPSAAAGSPSTAPASTVPATVPPPVESPSPEPPSTAGPSDPVSAEPSMPEPPAATVRVDGGDPVVGQLGAFSWMNGGSAAPWLPGTPIRVGAGEELALTLEQPVAIASWTVRRSPAADLGSDVEGMAEGMGEAVRFAVPPAGSWSVNVEIRFAGSLGSAAYFWRIDVD